MLACACHCDVTEKPAPVLSELDRRLILLTQTGLPLVPRPYHHLGEKLGVSADEVMARLKHMQENASIRRIAAVPNHYRLGFTVNGMSVWDVADEVMADKGKIVGALDFVSHCYRRPRHLPQWPYNLFAMVHGRSDAEVRAHIDTIGRCLGKHCHQQDVLYSKRILKKTGMRFGKAFARSF